MPLKSMLWSATHFVNLLIIHIRYIFGNCSQTVPLPKTVFGNDDTLAPTAAVEMLDKFEKIKNHQFQPTSQHKQKNSNSTFIIKYLPAK